MNTLNHTTQVLAKRLEEGTLLFKKEIRKVITYRDPCFDFGFLERDQ